MITMKTLASIFTRNIVKVVGHLQSMRPFAKFENTGKTLSDFPLSKLMNVVDTKKVHNDYEFTEPQDILPNKVSQRAQMATFIYY